MKDSNTIRFLDKYFGILICSILSLTNKFRLKKKTRPIKNVLIIELFEMGAAIMAYSSVNYIKNKLDNPHIYCLCLDEIKPSWELLNIIPEENILSVDGTNLFTFTKSLIKQIIFLRKKNLDLIIDFELFMRISSIISFLIKSRLKAGFYRYELDGLYRGNLYDIHCSFNQNTHISKNLLALTKTAINHLNDYPNFKSEIKTQEITLPTYNSDLKLNSKVKEKIKKLYPNYNNNKIILVCPDVGGVLSVRNYPKGYFVEVINKLLNNYPNYLVLLIGVKGNWSVCSFIENKVNNKRCINFCNQTVSLKELLELMTLSRLLITNDNGPAHFASLTQINILALFSTDTPFMYGPLGRCVILYSFFHCSPCISAFNHKNSKCKDNLCLKSIPPAKVFDYSLKLMSNKLKYRTINNNLPYI
jgi:ADP-heptose:LPS heptosyltransferase